ncbi:MAG: hypothetical protein M3159_01185 [Actinomycetota bacterium]|nr:hypothetical protein [Actinomycetota bacterium]
MPRRLAAVFFVIVTACGGGTSAADQRAAAKKGFIRQADARCDVLNHRLSELEPLARTDQAAAATAALPDFEALLAYLHDLPAPQGDTELSGILTGYDELLGNLRAVVAAKAADDEVVIQQKFDDLEAKEKRFARQAFAYGFKVCGQL